MKTHLPVALRKALLAALIAVSFTDYSVARAEALESGNVSVEKITESTADKTYTTGDGNVQIGSIETSVAQTVAGLTVSASKGEGTDNGNVQIGDSKGLLTNAQITAEGNLTIGQNPQDTTFYLTIKGDETSFVNAAGDITVNQSLMFHADESANDKFEMKAGKSIYFHGDETKISSGKNGVVLNSNAKTVVTAAGDIIIDSYEVYITTSSVVQTTNGGNIIAGRQFSVNQVTGDLIADGRIQFTGYSNALWGQRKSIHMLADSEDGLTMTASNINHIWWADVYVAEGDITLAGVNAASNVISGSTLGIKKKGDVQLYGGSYGSVTGSSVSTTDGKVSLSSKEMYVENSQIAASSSVDISGSTNTAVYDVTAEGDSISVGSESATTVVGTSDNPDAVTLLDASKSVSVTGASVTVFGETQLNSQTASVSVTATGADGDDTPSLLINEAELNAATTVTITSAQGTASVMNADIKGEEGVLVSGAVGTEVNSTTISESGAVTIGEKGATSVDNTTIAAGAVSIGGTTRTEVNGVDVDGASISVGSETGTTTITNTDDKDTTLDAAGKIAVTGTTVRLTDISVDSTGTDADGASVAITGTDVQVSGKNVTGTGSVTIAGTDSTAVDSVDVDGKTVEVGAADSGTSIGGGTIDGAAGVEVNGRSVLVNNNAAIKAKEGDVSLNTGTVNHVSSGTSITAESGGVKIALTSTTGGANIVTGAIVENDTIVSTSPVSITAGDGALVIDGGMSGDNLVDYATLSAAGEEGSITIKGKANDIGAAATLQAERDVVITSTGTDSMDGNQVSNSAIQTSAGDVALISNEYNSVINSSLNAVQGDVIIGDEGGSTETVTNGIASVDGIKTTITANQNVRIAGENVIRGDNAGDVSIVAGQGNINLSDDNTIINAEIEAQGAEGDVAITTGTGEKTTVIEGSAINGETVTIAGDTTDRSDANLAVVTGGATSIASRGEDNGVGLTLNNVFVYNTVKEASNIIAMEQGDIAILNRVDLQNGTLTIDNGAASDGRIVVDAGNVLNACAESGLEGRLTGAGDINKSGGDSLQLHYDHTEFTGSIYANGALGGDDGSLVDDPAANAGSWIEINGPGVGTEASIVLKNTDLVICTDKTQIGNLDTTQDSDANKSDTGKTLLTNGSYTTDDNSRRDFTLVGSVLEVNKGVVGDAVNATNLQLSDATLIKLDAVVDDAGQLSSDVINASGTVDVAAARGLNRVSPVTAPSTARLYVEGQTGLSGAEDGARTTIVTGTMIRDINEDVLYEVQKSANGTYQRTLQDRNMHLENSAEGVELVISENYRSCAKDAASQRVAEVIADLSDDFHHTEGTLAASNNTLERLVDAFDYTRSEAAAQAGLKSLAGQGHVLPMLMLYDASRHHLNQLRRQMEMPLCKWSGKGAQNLVSNAWATYTGAHDTLDGDRNMGDYTRSANGALMGIDTSVSCHWRLGVSLGYETSTGEVDEVEVNADAFFVDAYAAGVTGNFKHRASIGLGFTTFESDRRVFVDAGYHSFAGKVNSETDAISLNMGYEISSDYRINERSYLARYLAVNLAWHKVDDSKENGIAELGTSTEYDKEWQADVALGVSYNRAFAAVSHQNSALFYANAAVHVELLNDQSAATSRFGNAAWESRSMKRDTVYFELGTGVVVPLSPAWTATAGAAVELGSEHTSVSGNIGVRYSF